MFRWLSTLTLALLTLTLTAATPSTFAPGAVIGLVGTPHLWIADAQGILHWGGDTRALANKHVDWNNRRDIPLAELQTLPVGDPWLSAGLLKDGDPIYLVKWESNWSQPKLLHIQSIADVELFGINSNNYGNFVLDKTSWEQKYGLTAANLQREQLAAAVKPPTQQTWTSSTGKQLHIEVISYDPDGWPELVEENGFNDPPRNGYRYLILTIKVDNLASGEIIAGWKLQSGSEQFSDGCGVVPNAFGGVIQNTIIPAGQSVTGNICFQVPEHLRNLMLVPHSLYGWRGNPVHVVGTEALPTTNWSGIERVCHCARTRVDGGCDRRFRPIMVCSWQR